MVKGKNVNLPQAELLRKKLLSDKRIIHVEDLGSKAGRKPERMIADIARKSLSPPHLSALYARLIAKYKLANIIELGTSLGINTIYLSSVPDTKVFTLEGSDEIAALANLTFEFSHARNIELIRGNIDNTLPELLQSVRKVDFALIDANHTYEATLRYLDMLFGRVHEKSIIVMDDIHYSPGMEKAWKEAREHDLVYGSADLFRAGFLFFDPSLNKQHVILQF